MRDLDGKLAISLRPDPAFAFSLNKDAFESNVLNHEHIGKTSDELIALWNEKNSQDQVGFSQN